MPDHTLDAARGALASPPFRRRRRIGLTLGALVLVAIAAAWFARRGAAASSAAAQAARDPAARPVPVAATTAARRDVPLDVDGLGTVIAYRTVTVRPLVDGRLEQVLFEEGQAVKAGQVLAQIDPRPFQIQLKQAEGALARDQALLLSAHRDLERYRALASENLIAQQQADGQVATVGQLEGAVRIDQAAVESAHLNLDYARITSPVDGVTGLRQVDPGNVVHASDPTGLDIVTQLDPIAVVFTLPQDQLPAVAAARAEGPLTVDVHGRDGTAIIGSGRLEVVDNQINVSTSTVRLKAVLPNPSHALWPNQFVKARLHLSVQKGALVVPATAVQRGPSGSFVYVIGADSTVTPRPVELGATPGDLIVVTRGVDAGEQVVVDGQAQLRAGSKVAVRDATTGGGGGGAGGAAGQGGPAGPRNASSGGAGAGAGGHEDAAR